MKALKTFDFEAAAVDVSVAALDWAASCSWFKGQLVVRDPREITARLRGARPQPRRFHSPACEAHGLDSVSPLS